MLEITIPGTEEWDEDKEEFITTKETTLRLEHSLVSLSKWESRWGKPFLDSEDKTIEETLDYIRCMTLTQNVDPNVYYGLTSENVKQVEAYILAPMTATTISRRNNKTFGPKETITSELIYYWMIALNIPFECQKWHLNRLITLIEVCNIKNSPPKKLSRNELLMRNTELNAKRRKALNSKG